MKVSIIIPSYNASERLFNNLLYLNMQEYPRKDFEVIVVDNGSVDDTSEMLSSIETNYALNSIYINKNMGRAFARNYGVKEAMGDIIIFLDGDMIAEKALIAKHLDAHKYCNYAVSGQSWNRVYTYYYKNFSGYLKRNLCNKLKEKDILCMNDLFDKQTLFSKVEVLDGRCFESSFNLAKMHEAEKNILQKYGTNLNGYYFPWSLLVTNNCSMEKKLFLEVDGFDNQFIAWGCEDLDLGYRLYKQGCKFLKQNDIVSIHQEHPINFIDRGEENIFYFTKKYENIDLLLFYYGCLISADKVMANIIMEEISQLELPQYDEILDVFRRLLIGLRDISVKTNIKEANWFYDIKKLKRDVVINKETLKMQYCSLKKEGLATHFIYFFKKLTKKVLNINFEQLIDVNTI